MQSQSQRLILSQYAPLAAASVYTAASNTTVKITDCSVYNNDTSARELTAWIVATGQSADNTTIVGTFSVLPGRDLTIVALIGKNLNTADALHIEADAANVLTFHLNGLVTTI